MNIYIKKVKNTQGQIIETLWVNYTINGKRFRKSLEMENSKANYKRAEKEILPLLKYKLLNGELNQNKKIPTVEEYMCSISDNVSSCFTIMFPLLQTSFKSVKL